MIAFCANNQLVLSKVVPNGKNNELFKKFIHNHGMGARTSIGRFYVDTEILFYKEYDFLLTQDHLNDITKKRGYHLSFDTYRDGYDLTNFTFIGNEYDEDKKILNASYDLRHFFPFSWQEIDIIEGFLTRGKHRKYLAYEYPELYLLIYEYLPYIDFEVVEIFSQEDLDNFKRFSDKKTTEHIKKLSNEAHYNTIILNLINKITTTKDSFENNEHIELKKMPEQLVKKRKYGKN